MKEQFTRKDLEILRDLVIGFGDLMGEDVGPLAEKIAVTLEGGNTTTTQETIGGIPCTVERIRDLK